MTASQSQHPQRRDNISSFLSIVTLAGWQIRQTWRLLIVTALGMMAAVLLVCAVPLYSEVALNAGLRTLLQSDSANATINVHGKVQATGIGPVLNQLSDVAESDLGSQIYTIPDPLSIQIHGYGTTSPGLSLILPDMQEVQTFSQLTPFLNSPRPQMQLLGFPQKHLSSHVKLLAGRLPAQATDAIEIALTPQAAQCLYKTPFHSGFISPAPQCAPALKIGDELTLFAPFDKANSRFLTPDQQTALNNSPNPTNRWKVRLVGLFQPINPHEDYWHGASFDQNAIDPQRSPQLPNLSSALVATESLISTIDAPQPAAKSTNSGTSQLPPTPLPAPAYLASTDVFGDFHFNLNTITTDNLDSLLTNLNTFTTDATNNPVNTIHYDSVNTPADILSTFQTRLALAQIPVGLLLILIAGMALLFIAIATELLVERQTDVIAILRSRGASRWQIFSVFTLQSLLIALCVLFLGPLLAIPLTIILIHFLFLHSDMGALSLITSDPFQTVWGIRWYALGALGASLGVTLFTLYQSTRLDVLALRRETGRQSRPSLWQRFYLDALLGLLALAGYGYTLYILNTGTLNDSATIELLSPLVLISSMLVLLALLLLFLRVIPRLAQGGAHLAARRSGISGMLALANIARTPRQAQRIILLLTLTTALTIFTLIFSASQNQRIYDVVNYQVGADFSGWLPDDNMGLASDINLRFQHIPGVQHSSIGLLDNAQFLGATFQIKAVDTAQFAQTAIWSPRYSQQSLPSLMSQLSSQRAQAQKDHVLPVIVAADTAQALRVSAGSRVSITINQNTIPCQVLTIVQAIPTTNITSGTTRFTGGGILVDYQTYAALLSTPDQPIAPNYVWIRSSPEANQNLIRAALTQLMLPRSLILDRRVFIASQQQDPVILNLVGAMTIGTVAPLFLSLLGSLLISWLNARNRLLGFSLLRALGTSPRQLAGMISWEQGVIYTFMLVLGIIAGFLLSLMVLPSLIQTSIIVNGENGGTSNGLAQHIPLPQLQIIFPASLFFVIGGLILICFTALVLMVRLATHPSLSQTLRLNAD
ncbi:ABC transporter permease [Tengunoibacter tsumagoiensis]|uniref:ABC3 transporter permease C-terminal domain-containing protein n=1 Tax=Tengunoibacter tsumagoiensis TaxID=2014871 RepID=A0A402A371_9CHLR|nr:ABC transporter permease [Tengunoibacter tsumagoiensis]GCE13600.1 hypothetical protein KTT_34590 [Tengunoibacter tsumagoiensis]